MLVLTSAALAGCGRDDAEGRAQTDPELAGVARQVSELPSVEAVGAGRDGDAANLTITVTPDVSADRADELLDEGVRRLWLSELEPLTDIKVLVTPGTRGEGGADLVYDEHDLEQVREELVNKYGDR